MTTHYSPKKCSCIKCRKELRTADLPRHHYLEHEYSYPRLPRKKLQHGICKNCGKNLTRRDSPPPTFCNRSCSAVYNNKKRTEESRAKQSKSLLNTLLAKHKPQATKVKFLVCEQCSTNYVWADLQGRSKRFCSNRCLKDHKFSLMSKNAKDRGFGGVRPSCRVLYKGVYLGSSYELLTVEILESLNIRWEQPGRFKYLDPLGKLRTYTPDLYLPDFEAYLDPKNDFLINNINPSLGFKDSEKIKLVMEQNNIVVHVLSKDKITLEGVKHVLGIGRTGIEPVKTIL